MVAAEEGALPPHKRSSPPHDCHGDEGRHGEQRKRERRPAGAAGGGTEAPLHLPHRRSSLGRLYSLTGCLCPTPLRLAGQIYRKCSHWLGKQDMRGRGGGGRENDGRARRLAQMDMTSGVVGQEPDWHGRIRG